MWAQLMKVAPPPKPKCTPQAPLGSSPALVDDQYTADRTDRNGWPGGSARPGGATEESTRPDNSSRNGNRHPFWPPTFFSMQMRRLSLHLALVVCGDLSQTRPVSLSNTASLVNAGKTTNRCDAARGFPRLWVVPGSSDDIPCAPTDVSALP